MVNGASRVEHTKVTMENKKRCDCNHGIGSGQETTCDEIIARLPVAEVVQKSSPIIAIMKFQIQILHYRTISQNCNQCL